MDRKKYDAVFNTTSCPMLVRQIVRRGKMRLLPRSISTGLLSPLLRENLSKASDVYVLKINFFVSFADS